jgi:hypothetical protein
MMARVFEIHDAALDHVPLLIGLMGPSGSGKTFSALRLAEGIQKVSGGDICVIDTETKRAKHYADRFKFRHIDFGSPFGSADYLAAMRMAARSGCRTIIVDSMSHEHEGPGGLLDAQDQEVRRLAGDDYGTWKAEKYNMQAWIKPKHERRKLLYGLTHLNEDAGGDTVNLILCFRAKETSKPKRDERGKIKIEPMGFMPIAGDEFVFEMTMNCLLQPGCRGVPSWQSDYPGERSMMKLPAQFEDIMRDNCALDQNIGERLAMWARGGATKPVTQAPTMQPTIDLLAAGQIEAERGLDAYRAFWKGLTADDRQSLAQLHEEWKKVAQASDERFLAESAE